jgi:ERCC4-type nuclease
MQADISARPTTTKLACTLIIDTRERYVIRHEYELRDVPVIVRQITVGDYAVLDSAGKIAVIIERKSFEDFAASLKDGRSDNKAKLIELRATTGCAIVYLIEGSEFPDPNDTFGRIPYKAIESSIFHLMVRDGITVMRARNSLDTAKTLVRFVQSMNSLDRKGELLSRSEPRSEPPSAPIVSGTNDAADAGDTVNGDKDDNVADLTAPALSVEPDNALSLLTQPRRKTTHETVRELWAAFPGVSVESADEFMKVWSLSDIVRKRVQRADIAAMKTAIGRSISSKAVAGLTSVPKLIQARLLSRVPGISAATAAAILKIASLDNILSWEVGGIAMMCVKNGRRLGEVLAARILELFRYKYVPTPIVPPEPVLLTLTPPTPTPPIPTPPIPTPPILVPTLPPATDQPDATSLPQVDFTLDDPAIMALIDLL